MNLGRTSLKPVMTSGSYFCYDKYGNVTRKVVCVDGVTCDTSCP